MVETLGADADEPGKVPVIIGAAPAFRAQTPSPIALPPWKLPDACSVSMYRLQPSPVGSLPELGASSCMRKR